MSEAQKIDDLSFEQALGELETIVKSLESGDIQLEDSIKAYERGAALKAHCEARLKSAQLKIEKISVKPDGTVGTQPFETQQNS